jgi:hypothetical protein
LRSTEKALSLVIGARRRSGLAERQFPDRWLAMREARARARGRYQRVLSADKDWK